MIEFLSEGFRLHRRPKHNKKERRHLGLPKDREVIIQVASGNIKHKKTLRHIVRTAAIVSSQFDPVTGYFSFMTENGKSYKVKYKEEDLPLLKGE